MPPVGSLAVHWNKYLLVEMQCEEAYPPSRRLAEYPIREAWLVDLATDTCLAKIPYHLNYPNKRTNLHVASLSEHRLILCQRLSFVIDWTDPWFTTNTLRSQWEATSKNWNDPRCQHQMNPVLESWGHFLQSHVLSTTPFYRNSHHHDDTMFHASINAAVGVRVEDQHAFLISDGRGSYLFDAMGSFPIETPERMVFFDADADSLFCNGEVLITTYGNVAFEVWSLASKPWCVTRKHRVETVLDRGALCGRVFVTVEGEDLPHFPYWRRTGFLNVWSTYDGTLVHRIPIDAKEQEIERLWWDEPRGTLVICHTMDYEPQFVTLERGLLRSAASKVVEQRIPHLRFPSELTKHISEYVKSKYR